MEINIEKEKLIEKYRLSDSENKEIAKLYPQYYTEITNPSSNFWNDNLFNELSAKNYNIVFEHPGRNMKLLKRMIKSLHKYKIIVRIMAVNEINCLISIVDRYNEQIKSKGWGRIVTLENFYKAYNGILETADELDKMDEIDMIEVYKRGKNPINPVKVYSNKTKEYRSTKEAIIKERKFDKVYDLENLPRNILKEEKEIIDRIDLLKNEREKFDNER